MSSGITRNPGPSPPFHSLLQHLTWQPTWQADQPAHQANARWPSRPTLAEESSEVLKSNCYTLVSQVVGPNTGLLCCIRSPGPFGRQSDFVKLFIGLSPWSMIHWVLTVLRNYLKRNYLRLIIHIQRNRCRQAAYEEWKLVAYLSAYFSSVVVSAVMNHDPSVLLR